MKRFQRQIENFNCGHCGNKVTGNGYTNHCPVCLWSRHVDLNPGDRAADCGGMMRPVAVELKKGGYTIVHRCQKCGQEKRNKTSSTDNFDTLVEIAQQGG